MKLYLSPHISVIFLLRVVVGATFLNVFRSDSNFDSCWRGWVTSGSPVSLLAQTRGRNNERLEWLEWIVHSFFFSLSVARRRNVSLDHIVQLWSLVLGATVKRDHVGGWGSPAHPHICLWMMNQSQACKVQHWGSGDLQTEPLPINQYINWQLTVEADPPIRDLFNLSTVKGSFSYSWGKCCVSVNSNCKESGLDQLYMIWSYRNRIYFHSILFREKGPSVNFLWP